MDPEILRLIQNSNRQNMRCALRSGAFGLTDYVKLHILLKNVVVEDLEKYLDQIDLVRNTHQDCSACSLKFLAFCKIYSQNRVNHRFQEYANEFEVLRRECRQDENRDFMKEIQDLLLPQFS
jgi:hypothetical protein